MIPDGLLLEVQAIAAAHGITPVDLVRRSFGRGLAEYKTTSVVRRPELLDEIEVIL